jgi:hypothetical protein
MENEKGEIVDLYVHILRFLLCRFAEMSAIWKRARWDSMEMGNTDIDGRLLPD